METVQLTDEIAGRNPYFIGINSAILIEFSDGVVIELSQSLFYWN